MSENSNGNKFKSVVNVIVGLIVLAGIFVVAGTVITRSKQAVCDHVWNDGVVTKQATCTADGRITYTCENCGKEQTEIVTERPKHIWKYVGEKQATCTENGHSAYEFCTVCEQYKNDQEPEIYNAPGHDEGKVEGEEATCTKNGYTDKLYCKRCNEVFQDHETILRFNHEGGMVKIPAVEPTCEDEGSTEGQMCKLCGETYIAPETIPALGHNGEKMPDKEATCTEAGYTGAIVCTRCDEVISAETETPALGHNFVDLKCMTCGYEHSYLTSDLNMTTVSFARGSERPVMVFNADVSDELVKKLSTEGCADYLYMMLVETEKLQTINPTWKENFDWKKSLDESGCDYSIVQVHPFAKMITCTTGEIAYEKVNTKYSAIACVGSIDEVMTSYARVLESDARSVAYLSADLLGTETISYYMLGEHLYDDGMIKKLKSYIDEAVDLENGLAEPIYDGSTFFLEGPSEIVLTNGVGSIFVSINAQIDLPAPNFVLLKKENGEYSVSDELLDKTQYSDTSIMLTLKKTGEAGVLICWGGNAIIVPVSVKWTV